VRYEYPDTALSLAWSVIVYTQVADNTVNIDILQRILGIPSRAGLNKVHSASKHLNIEVVVWKVFE
jgi:hypothetical protein